MDYAEDLVESQGKPTLEAQKLVAEASKDQLKIKSLSQWGYGAL